MDKHLLKAGPLAAALAAAFVLLASDSGAFRFEAWPTTVRHVTQWFGENPGYYKRFYKDGRGHQGIDFAGFAYSRVYAVAPGQVTRVYSAEDLESHWHNFGIHVRIQHENGYETTYAHLMKAEVQLGEWVGAGQRIGLAGYTGRSGAAHLHLRLRRWGKVVDPTPFVRELLER